MKNKAFTLVEILIVVIILGILAAIVIPQFTEASNDARLSALQSDLQTMRSQFELYKVQHLENYPWQTAGNTTSAKVIAQLTSRTNSAGVVGTDATLFPFGPYLQQFPSNSFVSDTTTAGTITLGTADLAASGDGSTGWYINTTTGKVFCNDVDNSTPTAHWQF